MKNFSPHEEFSRPILYQMQDAVFVILYLTVNPDSRLISQFIFSKCYFGPTVRDVHEAGKRGCVYCVATRKIIGSQIEAINKMVRIGLQIVIRRGRVQTVVKRMGDDNGAVKSKKGNLIKIKVISEKRCHWLLDAP